MDFDDEKSSYDVIDNITMSDCDTKEEISLDVAGIVCIYFRTIRIYETKNKKNVLFVQVLACCLVSCMCLTLC